MDTITGTDGPDIINGGSSGADVIFAGAGNDTVSTSYGDRDTIYGGAGDDRLTSLFDGVFFGEAGNDTIIASESFFVRMDGGPGDDVMVGTESSERFVQVVVYASATGGVEVNLMLTGPQTVGGGMGVDTLSGFTSIVGSDYGDTLTASSTHTNNVVGGAGNDRLISSHGPTTFNPGPGDDTVIGGLGVDEVTLEAATGPLTVDLRLTTAQEVGGGLGVETYTSVEAVFGGAFDDRLTAGSSTWTWLLGGGGDDTITGLAGNDDLGGGDGDDDVYGGAGSDTIGGGDGANFLRGEDGDDWVVGGADTDDAHGNMGNDTVEGGAGDDWVVGGKDQDRLYGQDGSDVVLGNLGQDTLEGGIGHDVVRGGQGDDIVSGQAGNDWVSGDRGTDTLTGGAGADNFHVFDGSGVDRVTDFNAAEGDRVWLLPGTQWSAAQVGADTVVTVTGAEGGQLVLVGVTLANLPTGWIFGA